MYEKSEQIVVLQDEEEEEREQQEQLATGEQVVVPGQPGLNLPSKRTVGSERAVKTLYFHWLPCFQCFFFRLKAFWSVWK